MNQSTQPIYQALCKLPTCQIGIRCTDEWLNELVFLPPDFSPATPLIPNTLSHSVLAQLHSWLINPLWEFNLPLFPSGTIFQQRVWQSIREIPPGKTVRYQDIAASLNSSPRAVGQACGKNPYPLIIPCHRVTASKGLGGFAHTANNPDNHEHYLIRTKLWLLGREQESAEKTSDYIRAS